MELEFALKITRTRDDFTTELRIAKDRAGPLFLSRETETKFLLTAYLKGFKRERIKIAINEDGTQISISGEKSIQEMLMVKWVMYKKEPEVSRFCKVFWIPDGVILDRIKAKFNEDDSILTIVMPKKTRGIRGSEIEEVKQQHFDNEKSDTMTVLADKDPNRDDAARIGETSSASPQISHEGESLELASRRTIEVPPPTIPEYRKEMTVSKEHKVELEGELNQFNTPGSLPSEEMLPGELPILQPEGIEEHETPEDKAPEGELHEHDISPDSTEPEQVLHEPQMPPTQQIGNEELPLEEITQVAAQEPKKEPKEPDQGSEIRKMIGQPETLDQDQPLAQEIENHALNRAKEVHEEIPTVREEEVIDGVVPPQGKDRTDGEADEGLAKSEESAEESSKLALPETVEVPATTIPNCREEITRPEEFKVELEGELNQFNTLGSLPSEEMLPGELPILQPEGIEEHETPEDKAPEGELHEHNLSPDSTEPEQVLHEPQMPPTQQIGNEELPLKEITQVAAQEPKKEPKEPDQGSEIRKMIRQPETLDRDQPLAQEIENHALNRAKEVHEEIPTVREEEVIDGVVPPQGKDRTDGEADEGLAKSEESAEESSKLALPETVEVPATTIPNCREEITRPEEFKVELDGELNQSHTPDSLPSEQMLHGELPMQSPEGIEEHETPEDKAPEGELHEHDLSTDSAEPEQVLHEPQMPPTQQIRNEELPLEERTQVAAQEPKKEPKEPDQGSEIRKMIGQPETLDRDQPLAQEIEDHALNRAKEVHEEIPTVREEEVIDGVVPPQGKDRTDGEADEGLAKSEESAEESSKLALQETVEVPATRIPTHREEITRPEEFKVELDGELNQSHTPDSLPSEQMLHGELPMQSPEGIEEHETPEDKAPEGELHKHDLSPNSAEPEQVLHEPQMPPTQQIRNEELPLEEITQVAAQEPKKEPKEEDQGSEIRKMIGQPDTLDRDQPLAQEIEDHALNRAKEVHEEIPTVREEEVIDGLAPPQGKDRTDGEADEGLAKSEESAEESSKLALPETVEVPATTIQTHREEITRPEEFKVELDGKLNQSHTSDSLPSEQMLNGKLPMQPPEEIEQHERDDEEEPSEAKTPEAMDVLADKGTRREDVQEEFQPKTEEPKPPIIEDDDRIGETSSDSPKISHEEEPSELASPETLEVPTKTILKFREEMIRAQEHNVEPDGELKQSNTPDSLPSEEMLRGELPILHPEKAKEQEIDKAKAPKTISVLADKDPKRDNVQEELQSKREEPKQMTVEDDDRIGETSSESLQISHEDEPSTLASPETIEVPTTTLMEYREEITRSKELKVKSDGELNQSNAQDSLPSEEMLRGKLPILQPNEEHKIPKAKAPETMAVLADKDSKRDDVQQELRTESEAAPKAMTREHDNLIGETSSKSPKISHKEEPSELVSPKTIEVPATTIQEHREEITRPEELKVEPDEELNQLRAPDSLPSKQMLRGELPVQQPEKWEEHEIPEANAPETMAILVDKDPKMDDVQEELQPQTKAAPKPMIREDDDQIGETSSESPKISQEEESSEFASPKTIEVPATTIQEHREEITRSEELNVEPDGELNQSNAPDSLPSKEMLRGELLVREIEKTEDHITTESKAPETMAVLSDKGPKRNDVQEEFQLETDEEPKPITREDDNRIGETSSESPNISIEENSSVLASTENEVPTATIPEYRGEVTKPRELKVEPNEELNKSRASDSLLSVEIPCGEHPILQPEETEEHEIPEAKATEGEPHEHDLGPDVAEPEQGLHEPQTPEMPPTQQIGNEALPREEITPVAAEEPAQEPKEQDQGSKIKKPKTLDQDQPVAQEIEDYKLGKAEEVTDGVVLSQGEDQTEGEPDEEGLAKLEDSDQEESLKESVNDLSTQTQGGPNEAGLAESKEADKEESPKVELKKSISDQSTQTEGEPDEGFAELEEANKEESAKAELKNSELKKSVSNRSTQTEGELDDGGFTESDKEESLKKSVTGLSTQTQGEPDEARLAESKEASKEKSQKAELKKSINQSTQTERELDDEGLAESEEEDKEESPTAELKKSVSDRSTQTEADTDDEEVDKEDSSKVEVKKSFTDRSTQTEWSPSRKPSLCPSLFAGSAFLVSLILLAIQLLRSKKKRKPI